MITARGGDTLIVGLSAENMKRLMLGQPIHVFLASMGVPGKLELVIMGGATEESMIEELRAAGMVAPGATVTDGSKAFKQ